MIYVYVFLSIFFVSEKKVVKKCQFNKILLNIIGNSSDAEVV